MAVSSPAVKIEELASAAAERAESESDRRVYLRIARDAKTIRLGFACRPLTSEESMRLHDFIVPEPTPNGWSQECLDAALAVDLDEVAFEEVDQALSVAHRAYEHFRNSGARGDGASKRLRELDAAVIAARAEREEAGLRLVAARVAHAALVRRDDHRHRLERVAVMDAAAERERQEAAKARHKAGRATLRQIVKGK